MSTRILLPLLGLVLAGLVARDDQARAQDEQVKDPVWKRSFDMRSRKAGEEGFGDKTKQYGLECYLDENNGAGVYIAETGSGAPGAGQRFRGGDGRRKAPPWPGRPGRRHPPPTKATP